MDEPGTSTPKIVDQSRQKVAITLAKVEYPTQIQSQQKSQRSLKVKKVTTKRSVEAKNINLNPRPANTGTFDQQLIGIGIVPKT